MVPQPKLLADLAYPPAGRFPDDSDDALILETSSS